MKRKILVIALSLALLSSLFVFAAPIGVGAADSGKPQPCTVTTISGLNPTPGFWYFNNWYGPPTDLSGSGTERHWSRNASYVLDWTDFGPVDAIGTITGYTNYAAGRGYMETHLTVTVNNGTYNGTLELLAKFHRYHNGTTWISMGTYRVISGTGDLENYHFVGQYMTDTEPGPPIGVCVGKSWFSP